MRIIMAILRQLLRVCKSIRGLYHDSPFFFAMVLGVLLLVLSVVSLFSMILAHFLGTRGAILMDVVSLWLFGRLVGRALMFPGSIKLFQRNTEATFRVEVARQYSLYLRQLLGFLQETSRGTQKRPQAFRNLNADGISRGCSVIQTLCSSFKMQQQHEVHLSKEQDQVFAKVQAIERWLNSTLVRTPYAGAGPAPGKQPTTNLADALRQVSAGEVPFGVTQYQALVGLEILDAGNQLTQIAGKLQELVVIFEDLKQKKKSRIKNFLRFCRSPTVGSLDQLRTELQMRFSGKHYWVPVLGGHRLDAMFIPCSVFQEESKDSDSTDPANETSSVEDFSQPTVIWCNPNAAYYELMVYQPHVLRFWLCHGCNLLLFNYSGYGRSTGNPTPARIAEDGESVLKFLKGKGATKIGVYGRSIGGVVACHLGRHHSDRISFLVADRTMSNLEATAKYAYGNWAAKGLHLISMMADNTDNFFQTRCYKLLICDPKDTMILDLAALRTGIALKILEGMAPEERFALDDEQLVHLSDAWTFFGTLFAICECDEDIGLETGSGGLAVPSETWRSARQPNFPKEEQRTDVRLKLGENGEQVPSVRGSAAELVSTAWLVENAALVRSSIIFVIDQVRSALNIVGENLEGGGAALNDVFADYPDNSCLALRCMLANLQVWGTVGDQQEGLGLLTSDQSAASCSLYNGVTESEIEFFLQRNCDDVPRKVSRNRMVELEKVLAPEMLASYHRRLARTRMSQVRKEFRRRLIVVQQACSHSSETQAGEQVPRLLQTVLHHLDEVEKFVSHICRFFKKVDLALPYKHCSGLPGESLLPDVSGPIDSSDEKFVEASNDAADTTKQVTVAPQPAIDHASAGFVMHVDCGHNGALEDVDLRLLALHMRAAGFGTASEETV